MRGRAALWRGNWRCAAAVPWRLAHVEQLPEPPPRFSRDQRVAGEMDVIEVPAYMRPACDFDHGRRLTVGGLIERPEPGIAVGLQEAVEVGQLRARMFGLAIRDRKSVV